MIKSILQIISWASLFILTVPSVFYLFSRAQLRTVHSLMVIATLIWFGSHLLLLVLQAKKPVNE